MSSSELQDDSGTVDIKKEFSNPNEIIDEIKSIDDELNDLLKQAIKKRAEKEKLYKLLNKEISKNTKELHKYHMKKKNHSKGGGLSVPYEISSTLKNFLTLEEQKYSRGDITKILTAYIKDNDLKDPENSKVLKITNKSSIFKILKVKDGDNLRNLNSEEMSNVTIFGGINKYIQHHFIK